MDEISLNKQEALELIMDENTVIIDCRNPEELIEIPPITEDCYNIPLGDNFMNDVLELNDEIKKETKIVVYCAHGIRSQRATILLREAGYNASYSLEGGIAAVFEDDGC
ncbi:MAG: rhodanese-like domain-containing protein [Fusobacteriaceae bacterium]